MVVNDVASQMVATTSSISFLPSPADLPSVMLIIWKTTVSRKHKWLPQTVETMSGRKSQRRDPVGCGPHTVALSSQLECV